jgi:hypothetical protein
VRTISSQTGRIWPLVFLFFTLAIFCTATIHKASLAVAPPVYDSLSYYWKAITSLRAWQAGEWFTLMGTEPALRPPGFLLFNGLFCIDRDVFNFWSFFAMNMILPLLLWSLACWIAIPLRTRKPQLLWRKSMAVAALSLLPMFLQFEYSEEIKHATSWGLQDTSLASSAALAVALVMWSLRRRRVLPAVAGFGLAGFTLLVKPAGILVVLSVVGVWVMEAFFRWCFLKSPVRQRVHLRYFFKILVAGVALQAAIFCVAFFSPYFSKEIIEISQHNQSLLVNLTKNKDFIPVLAHTLSTSIGWLWAVFFLIAVPSASARLLHSSKRMSALVFPGLLSGMAILGAAFYWWRNMSGMEARYILPFVCLGIVLALPVLWTAWTHRCPTRLGSAVFGILASFVILYSSALAWPGKIPIRLQEFLGVNLSTGGYQNTVEAGRFLVEKSKAFNRPVVILQANMPYTTAFVSGWLMLENLKKEDSFKLLCSFDWRTEKTVPKYQIIQSDFIVQTNTDWKKPSEHISIESFNEEKELFNSWIAFLDGDSGTKRHSFENIDIVEVVDRKKFEAAFDFLVSSKATLWRREFLEYNGYIEGSWQNQDHARTSFSATEKTLGGILVGLRDLEESRLKDLGECVPTGRDPYFCLKPFLNFGSSMAILRIQTTATSPGRLQIFYSGQPDAFLEAKSLWRPMNAGSSEVTATIPIEGEATWLRIDLPGPPAESVIKKLSIILVNPVDVGRSP